MKNTTINIIFSLLILISCTNRKTKLTHLQGNIFGTTYHITYDDQTNYQKSIDSLFDKINQSLSTYIPNSLISKINNNDSTVVADKYLIEIFKKAKKIHKETNGYFDPTIGQLVNAYGFGSKKTKEKLNEKERIRLTKLTGFEKISLQNNKIHKQNPEVQFDVNSFAKGYGIDIIGRFLETKKIKNYLVEIGGEIRTRGLKYNKPWRIGVENPNSNESQSVKKIIELNDKSMATSGNYRKYKIDDNGKKIVHIVNPKTGLATESNLLSASVIANGDCADVDAYATAFMAMGLEKTKLFLQKHQNLKVILIYQNNTGEIKTYEN